MNDEDPSLWDMTLYCWVSTSWCLKGS